MLVTDPSGNRLDLQQPVSEAEEALRRQRADAMRAYVRQQLDEGMDCPTPAELVEAIGRPMGLAMDVLCEFEEYAGAP